MPRASSWPARHLPQALLGYVLETRLAGLSAGAPVVTVTSPWDLWWVCFRTAIPAGQVGVTATAPAPSCAACADDARELAAADPPRHPGMTPGRACGCLLEWAVRMRAPAAPVTWPPLSLTLALIKPGAPVQALRARLERTSDVLQAREQTLTTADVRRLYPEAFGEPGELKKRLRQEMGATDVMRNHLHMADNPAEALADIRHLAGQDVLAGLYERHERDRAADRIAFYRAALGIRQPGAHSDET